MAALPLIGNAFCKEEMEYNGTFGHTLGRIQNIALMIIIDIFTLPAACKPKLWHLLLLFSKVSISALNIWLVTLIN